MKTLTASEALRALMEGYRLKDSTGNYWHKTDMDTCYVEEFITMAPYTIEGEEDCEEEENLPQYLKQHLEHTNFRSDYERKKCAEQLRLILRAVREMIEAHRENKH